jgi:hypothetical protein
MHKLLFLEYKFRDFTDAELAAPAATGVMAAYEKLNGERVEQIRRLNLQFGVSFMAVDKNICPLSDEAERFCLKKLEKIVKLTPDVVWFDYLMFPGKWNVQSRGRWDIDRKKEILTKAKFYLLKIPKNIKSGYFSMPYREGRFDNWEERLGQDTKGLGALFDYLSPMLYHRMMGESPVYISEFVKYLHEMGVKARIIPTIQLKDMPDDLLDELKLTEIGAAIDNAIRPPSSGVAVFSWDQTIEKGKIKSVSEYLVKVKS